MKVNIDTFILNNLLHSSQAECAAEAVKKLLEHYLRTSWAFKDFKYCHLPKGSQVIDYKLFVDSEHKSTPRLYLNVIVRKKTGIYKFTVTRYKVSLRNFKKWYKRRYGIGYRLEEI